MTTDLYAKCPCGSGKKIKFCCKDIIADIERIERMLQGEQRTAALDKIDKLLEKHADRVALLCLKAQVHLELQDLEAAAPVVDRLLEVEPENPSALAMKATMVVMSGDLTSGLALLHHALRASDGVLSKMVYRSYISVCMQLIQQEEFISAYAHLLTMVSITKGEERTSVTMLMNLASSEKLPAIFQGLLVSDSCPDNVTWKREFDVAMDHYRRGDWSSCADLLDGMSKRILDEPVLLRNTGILQAWTCRHEEAVKSFRSYAAIRQVEQSDAVEAEACAQVLESPDPTDTVALRAVTQEVDDADEVMEKLLSANDVRSIPVERAPDASAPPPKGQFVFYDRELSDDAAESFTDLPQEICSATLRGKETDRPAQLILLVVDDEGLSVAQGRLQELLGLSLNVAEGEVVGQLHKVERIFRPRFAIPPKTSLQQHQQLQEGWMQHQLREVWPQVTLSQFGHQSAKEAAGQRKYERAVLGSILNLEMWMDRQPFPFDFNALRGDLGLPQTESIDPATVHLRTLSPSKLLALEVEKLTDEDLKFMFEFLSVRPNGKLLYRLGKEILARPQMKELVDRIEVYERLANLAPTTDETLDYIHQARELAVSAGESPAAWLIGELDVRIQRGESDQVNHLMSEIQARYLREPGVANLLASVLGKYGLLPAAANAAAGSPAAAPAGAPVAAAASEGGIWTPEGDDASASSGDESGQGASKLWVPGMD